MVGKIDLLQVGIEKTSLKTSPKIGGNSFMDVLKREFEHVTSKLKDVPGMPGIFTLNPQPPQTLETLNITSRVSM